MNKTERERLRLVRDYHERTKHRPEQSAASLGYMDWANQPDPFRTFAGAEQIELPHPELLLSPTFDELYANCPATHPLDADLIGRLFYRSLALSAWKQAPGLDPWSLRINPSSGALHPTEGYLIAGPVPELFDRPGVFHYAPYPHRLERRCDFSTEQWDRLMQDLPQPCLLIGLTSIYWRESWKYGERAFRYCNHDVGHAIGAIAYSARLLGWESKLMDGLADADLDRLLGAHLQSGIEAEHADCLLALYSSQTHASKPAIPDLSAEHWRSRMPNARFAGEANRLSGEHHPWPAIDLVSGATRNQGHPRSGLLGRKPTLDDGAVTKVQRQDRGHPAEEIVRRRRSAVAMDGVTSLDRDSFYRMLERTRPSQFPFAGLPWPTHVSLAIFVHRVDDLEPGLYLLVRSATHRESLRESLKSDFEWQKPEGCPPELQLVRLLTGDSGQAATMISCQQDIAGDGAFSLGMLAELDAALAAEGAACYPRLFWETGLIGQVLYLEAEAAGMRGTGIGCFFDDLMHELLGIADQSWQSLYHFTLGGAVEDKRLKTLAPYDHLLPRG